VVPGRRVQLYLGLMVLLDIDEVNAALVVDLRDGQRQRRSHRGFGGAQCRFEIIVALQ